MQIALWSNGNNGDGTTALSGMIASLIAANYNHKTLLTHTLIGDLSMESYILKPAERHEFGRLGESNIDDLFRLINNGKLEAGMIKDYCYSLLAHSNLDFLSSWKVYEDTERFRHNYLYLNHMAKKFYDVIVTDLNVDLGHPLFDQVLRESDFLVVVGSQSVFHLNQLVEKISDHKEKLRSLKLKVFFVVNKFDLEGNISPKHLLKPYKLKEVSIIPYQIQVLDACNNSELVDFILRQIHNQRKTETWRYVKGVKGFVDKMMDTLEEGTSD